MITSTVGASIVTQMVLMEGYCFFVTATATAVMVSAATGISQCCPLVLSSGSAVVSVSTQLLLRLLPHDAMVTGHRLFCPLHLSPPKRLQAKSFALILLQVSTLDSRHSSTLLII